jgi:hypothetical protein
MRSPGSKSRLADSFRATLQSRWPGELAFYEEQLDLSLFKDGTPPPEVRELLRRKHQDRRFDLVVPMESRTLRIAVANRAELFSGAPIVFAAVDRTAAADIPLDGDVTGTWLTQGWAGTLEAALALHPRTRRVVASEGPPQRTGSGWPPRASSSPPIRAAWRSPISARWRWPTSWPGFRRSRRTPWS